MGGEIWMVPEKGEAAKVKAVLKGNSCVGPKLDGSELPCDFWIGWRGNRLELGYTVFSGNGEWAYAVALALCRRFKFKKAGWDSVGYCETMEEFTKGRPFGADIEMFEEAEGLRGVVLKVAEMAGCLGRLKRNQQACEAAADELVGLE